jgi:hypothetical protein
MSNNLSPLTRNGLFGSSSANCGVAGALSLRFLNKLIFNNIYGSNKKYIKASSIVVQTSEHKFKLNRNNTVANLLPTRQQKEAVGSKLLPVTETSVLELICFGSM